MRYLKSLYYLIRRLIDRAIYEDVSFLSGEMHAPYQSYIHHRKRSRLFDKEHIPGPVAPLVEED